MFFAHFSALKVEGVAWEKGFCCAFVPKLWVEKLGCILCVRVILGDYDTFKQWTHNRQIQKSWPAFCETKLLHIGRLAMQLEGDRVIFAAFVGVWSGFCSWGLSFDKVVCHSLYQIDQFTSARRKAVANFLSFHSVCALTTRRVFRWYLSGRKSPAVNINHRDFFPEMENLHCWSWKGNL